MSVQHHNEQFSESFFFFPDLHINTPTHFGQFPLNTEPLPDLLLMEPFNEITLQEDDFLTDQPLKTGPWVRSYSWRG